MFTKLRSSGEPPPDEVTLNPAAFAQAKAAEPMPYDDTRLPDQDGSTPPQLLREEARAERLGRATGDQVIGALYSDGLTESQVAGLLAARIEAERYAQLWSSQLPDRLRLRESLSKVNDALLSLLENVDCSISPKRRFIGLAGKPLMLAGDASVFASILYLSGVPLTLAVLAGGSTGASLVGAGSHWGKEEKFAADRIERGEAPEGASRLIMRLFDSKAVDYPSSRLTVWRRIALTVGLTVLSAFTALGVAVGDPPGKALAIGLLAAITVAGSAALEAYAANEAADLRDKVGKQSAELSRELAVLNEVGACQAAALQKAGTLEVAAQHASRAARDTVAVTADRSPENPATAGTLARPEQAVAAPDSVSSLPRLSQLDNEVATLSWVFPPAAANGHSESVSFS